MSDPYLALDTNERGMALRLAMLMTHYRKPIDFTLQRLSEAAKIWKKWHNLAIEEGAHVPLEILEALSNDLNTPQALVIMHGYVLKKKYSDLFAAMKFLGLIPEE